MYKMKYCSKCIMPETVEGQKFDKKGECITCQAQGTKKDVDWAKREKELERILKEAKENSGNNYDCIVPISGGKDSLYQLHVIKKHYGLKPLAVTFNHNWFTKTGFRNLLTCLEKLDIDHIMFTPNRKLVNNIAKRSVETIGDACWHCHAGVAAFTLKAAVMYGIKLIIWGESGAEYGHQGATYNNMVKFDKDYFTKLSAKLSTDEFSCDYISMKDLFPFELPTEEECKNINGIHLGNYIKWDTERQVNLVKRVYGWKGREIGGSYKDYKSAECCMAGIHDFLCYLKRGFGRSSIQSSQEIREGKLSRDEALELIKKYERIEPIQLNYFLEIAGLTPIEFREQIEKLRHEAINFPLTADKEWRDVKEERKPYFLELIEGE